MKSYRTVKYINGLLPMQYVFLIRSRAGCKKYVTRLSRVTYFLQPARECIKNTYCLGKETVSMFIANLHEVFNDILRKNHGTLFYCGRIVRHYDSERVCGRVLKFSQNDGIDSV